MVQAFLNAVVFGMDPQSAVEAPRFVTRSFPDSFTPHNHQPGQLNLEGRIARETGDALASLGHRVEWWPDRTSRAGGMCLLEIDAETGILHAGADCRRAAYALGW
jgi:gamma-glutamyltranspeptidase/glutathione hydrolase